MSPIPVAAGAWEEYPPIAVQNQWDLLPNGRRVKGVNICGPNLPNNDPKNPAGWAQEWVDFPSLWTSWLKPQIDAAQSAGFNLIVTHGTQYGRTGSGAAAGTAPTSYAEVLDQTTYLGYWKTLLDYCRSIGMYVSAGFNADSLICDFGGVYGFTPGSAWLLSEYQAWGALIGQYPDVVAFTDLAIESASWSKQPANSLPAYQAVKKQAPRIKHGWSLAIFATLTDLTALPANDASDIYILHSYYNPGASDFDPVVQAFGKPLVLGEWGKVVAGDAAWTARATAILGTVNHSDAQGRRIAGQCLWSMRDNANTAADIAGGTSDDYGYQDYTGATRSAVVAPIAAFPS